MGILLILGTVFAGLGQVFENAEGAGYEYVHHEVFEVDNITLTQYEEYNITIGNLSKGYLINYQWKQLNNRTSAFRFWVSKDGETFFQMNRTNNATGEIRVETEGEFRFHWYLYAHGHWEKIMYRIEVTDAPPLDDVLLDIEMRDGSTLRQDESGSIPVTVTNDLDFPVTVTGIRINETEVFDTLDQVFDSYFNVGITRTLDIPVEIPDDAELGMYDLDVRVTFDYHEELSTYEGLWQTIGFQEGLEILERDGDHDSVVDSLDDFPDDPAASLDTDGDGLPDRWNEDMGPDNSTTGLYIDEFPEDKCASKDRDGDGCPEEWNEGIDPASEGTELEFDSFPDDPAAHIDADGDGYPDRWNTGKSQEDSTTDLIIDELPQDANEWRDTDGDGIGDNSDDFPEDPAASLDSDGDGHPDEWNSGKTGKDSPTGLKLDEYPNDAGKWKDESSGTLIIIILVIVLVLLILIGGGAALFFLVIRKKPEGKEEESEISGSLPPGLRRPGAQSPQVPQGPQQGSGQPPQQVNPNQQPPQSPPAQQVQAAEQSHSPQAVQSQGQQQQSGNQQSPPMQQEQVPPSQKQVQPPQQQEQAPEKQETSQPVNQMQSPRPPQVPGQSQSPIQQKQDTLAGSKTTNSGLGEVPQKPENPDAQNQPDTGIPGPQAEQNQTGQQSS